MCVCKKCERRRLCSVWFRGVKWPVSAGKSDRFALVNDAEVRFLAFKVEQVFGLVVSAHLI